jgi:hypothetical protein
MRICLQKNLQIYVNIIQVKLKAEMPNPTKSLF